jgi:hypothetical protein
MDNIPPNYKLKKKKKTKKKVNIFTNDENILHKIIIMTIQKKTKFKKLKKKYIKIKGGQI